MNYSLSVDSLKMIHMYDYLPHLRKDTISIIHYRDIDYKPYEIEHYSMDSGLTGQYVLYTRSSEIPLRYSKGLSTMMSYKKSAYDILRNKYYKEGARHGQLHMANIGQQRTEVRNRDTAATVYVDI